MNDQVNEKLVYGVGVMDVPGGTASNGKTCPIYRTWCKMLKLCFNNHPAKATICPEWIAYSNYLQWHEANVPKGGIITRDKRYNHFSPDHVRVRVPKKRITLKDIAIVVDGVSVSMETLLQQMRQNLAA